MALYPYVAALAFDPASRTVVANATGQVYAKTDTTYSAALTTVDASGQPLELTTNEDGVLPSFYVDGHAGVNWKSGSWVFPLVTSEPLPGPQGPPGSNGRDGSNVVPTAEAVARETAIQVPPLVADTIANDPTVAQNAATLAQSDAGLVRKTDPGIPTTDTPSVWAVADNTGAEAITVREDGTVGIPDLDRVVRKVHLIIGAGQSNMMGKAQPIGGGLDPADSRIFQFGWNAQAISEATVPLDMINTETGIGLSPLTVIAREYARTLPDDEIVLLIPAGRGGAGLAVDTGSGWWKFDGAGSYYPTLLTRVKDAITASENLWRVTPTVEAFFWHQGETDGMQSVSTTDYATAFDALVADLRTQLAVSDLPVILGGMVPEWVDGAANRSWPRVAHVATPIRLTRAAYAEGARNGGGASGATDLVHYHRDGILRVGQSMFRAWQRALANTTASVPYPPAQVRAALVGGELVIDWDAPLCRYTGFNVYWTIDGGVEQSASITTGELRHVVTGITGSVASVQVATVNANGTSNRTTTVKIGA